MCPTVWEDLAKTLLTTNTTWNITIQMCHRLVKVGDSSGGEYAFPDPEKIAKMNISEINEKIRAGYRGAYLHSLAKTIANGSVDVESWRHPNLGSQDIYRKIKSLKGFGDYAAGSMLKLLGRFDKLGIDSSCREVYRVQINNGIKPLDSEIVEYYSQFGEWSGLAMWMDVMKVNLLNRSD